MNKKICVLICFMLLLGAIIPIASNALILRPDKGPLKKIILESNGNRRYEARPPGVGGGKPEPEDPVPDPEGDYALMPFHWKETDLAITYNVDISNSGITEDEVKDAISFSAEEWDSWTGTDLFNEAVIITDGSFDKRARNTDDRNEIVFGKYKRNVIAVTIIWYWSNGEIKEFDIMFNTDFTWGTDLTYPPDSEVMDLQNIATHELGHAVCLGDLYDIENLEQTMYGYSWYGDIGKRDLFDGDKAGILYLYG